jgi:hypothetical protein
VTASSVANWQGILASQAALMNRNAKSATVKAALDHFAKAAPKISKVDDLLKDRKLLQTVLTTYGLEGEINNVGRLRQLLTQDPKDPKSLLNRLVDPRYTKFVVDLSFFTGTPAALKDPAYQDKIAQTYTLNTYEQNLGNQDPALREAAYFLRNASSVTSVYQLLGDKVMRDVVTKALQLPAQFVNLDIDQQAKIISSRINIKDLQGLLGKNAALYNSATEDQVKITSATDLTTKASAVVKTLTDSLANIEKLYDALGPRQDASPSGVNQAKIADQNAYVAKLTNVRGSLDAATARTSDLVSSIDRLKVIAQTIGSVTTDAELETLKNEFHNTATRLWTNIENANYPAGTTQNLLKNTGVPTSVTIGTNTFNFNSTDLSSVQTALTASITAIDNLAHAGDTPAGTVVTDLDTARATSVAGIAVLNQSAQTYGQALNSVNSNLSVFQQQLLSRADSSVLDATSRATQINSKLVQIQSALEASQSGTANRALIDADVQQFKADIERLVRGNTGSTDNLLVGDAGYGSVQGLSLDIHGGDFLNQIVAKLKDVNAFSETSAKNGATLISESLRPLVSSRVNTLRAEGAYVQSAAGSANFAIAPDTAGLRLGSQSAADALDRATQAGVLLGQLRGLAQSAVAAGDGSTAINVTASDLIQKINTLINTPGTGLDNLLVGGGTASYNYLPGNPLQIGKADLPTSISSKLAAIDLSSTGSTTAALQAIDDLNRLVLPALADAKLAIQTGAQTINTARRTFDPRAAIDDLFSATVANITTQVAGASVNGKNLLNSAADQLLFLKSTPGTYTVSGHSEFDTQITRQLQTAVKALLSSATLPTTAIHQAILQLNSVAVDLTGDITQVKHGTRNVDTLLAEKKKTEAQNAAAPYQGTRLAKLLTNQFLAFDQGTGTDTSQANLAQILLGGQSSTTGILNLLI